ncbi:MAG TPA: excinuclease ABC subunit UvrC [Casimicrobiaceae bacterium]|jgi:excinuclease ABC subunit C|nr:excinuclease ABC subunit UvrC [Casimicrobiaceae bacterium]
MTKVSRLNRRLVTTPEPAAAGFDPRELIASLPHRPGVYRFFDAQGAALYVGKAGDLRKRVSNYFQKSEHEPRIAAMIPQIARVDTTAVRSNGEALLLENNLIKALEPRYNILFRDDKSYPYVCLSGDPFPQLRFHRGTLDRKHKYFGPFPSAGAVRDGIATLQKVFQIRTCENTVFANRSRPCMLHQIQRCTAPCVGLIGEEEYAQDVQSALLFLQGKTDEVLAQLKMQMDDASAKLDFERAARIRDKIHRLQQLQSRQFVESATAGDIDVVAAAIDQGVMAVNVVMIRGGRHLGDRTFFPRNAEAGTPAELINAFLPQHYVERPVPPTIVAPEAEDAEALAEVLTQQAGRNVEIVTNPGGERRVWVTMATQNTVLAIRQKLAQKATQEERLAALQDALGLPSTAQRIECFDVSHTMGEAAVASCVIFDRLSMRTNEYRKFNVTPEHAGDDYAALREALTRRCARIVAGEYPAPDLLVIDGGKGQVGIAAEVLAEQGLHQTPLIGMAKGPERKPGLEDIVFPNRDDVLNLPSDHPGLHLLQQIRDEAHRFAIQGHRARRAKARNTSSLQAISGIGSKRRQALLAHFGGLKGVQAASVDDLARVPGVSRALAERIYAQLH